MSYEIIYQYQAFEVDGDTAGDGEKRYVLAVESGSNNCYVGSKRARRWGILAVGTHKEVLVRACEIASGCEGGGLKPGGKDCSPERFIGKVRRLMRDAGKEHGRGYWVPEVRDLDDDLAQIAVAMGGQLHVESRGGSKQNTVTFGDRLKEYFAFITEHGQALSVWSLARVGGLPSS